MESEGRQPMSLQGYPAWVEPSSSTFCVAAGCATAGPRERDVADVLGAGPQPRHPVPGSDLCPVHERELGQLLERLSGDVRELRRAVLSTSQRKGGGVRPGNTATVVDVGARWNPAATPALRHIEEYTGFLVRTVLAERILPEGHRHGLTPTTRTELALAALARHHASWLARYPDLGPDILDTLHDLGRRAHAALETQPVKRVIVRDRHGDEIRCADAVLQTDLGPVLCEAPLVAVVTPVDPQQPEAASLSAFVAGHIVCSADPAHHQYTKAEWLELRRLHGDPTPTSTPARFISLELAAEALQLSPRRTAEIAAAEGWRTAGTRPEQYAIDDITRTAQLRGARS